MKRWLLVVAPALAIAVLGTVFVIATDRDPEPLAPSAALASPSASPSSPSGASGAAGPTPTAAPTEAPEPTGAEVAAAPEGEGERSEEDSEAGSGGVALPSPPPDPGTVTLEVTASSNPGDPQVFSVPLGATVLLEVTSTNVTDRVVVGSGAISVKVAPGAHKTLEFSVDEPGKVRVSLQDADAVLATIAVGS